MKTTIEIECSDFDELLMHLSVIRAELKKRNKKSIFDEDFKECKFDDSNCYGDHTVKVIAL